jgi:polar amino acid transport system substrate-binding protein
MFDLKTKLAGALFAAAAMIAGPAAADLQEILAAGKVRIGVPVDVPPFGFVGKSNEPVGLDVDVANMIGKALGVEVELQQITGANRIPYLVTDRLDMVISAMGATPERVLVPLFRTCHRCFRAGFDCRRRTRRSWRSNHCRSPGHDAGSRTDRSRPRCQDHPLRR